VRDEEAAKQLDAEYDPWICEDNKLDLAEMVEEQLILCMPLVSYHDSGDCLSLKNYVSGAHIEEDAASSASKESPFAVLRSLKDNDSNT